MRLTLESIGQLKFMRSMLVIGSLSLVSILIWMTYSLYDIYSRDATEPDVLQYLNPLNPSLDLDTLESLQDRYAPPQDFTIIARQIGQQGQSGQTFTITRDGQAGEASSSGQTSFDNLNNSNSSSETTLP